MSNTDISEDITDEYGDDIPFKLRHLRDRYRKKKTILKQATLRTKKEKPDESINTEEKSVNVLQEAIRQIIANSKPKKPTSDPKSTNDPQTSTRLIEINSTIQSEQRVDFPTTLESEPEAGILDTSYNVRSESSKYSDSPAKVFQQMMFETLGSEPFPVIEQSNI